VDVSQDRPQPKISGSLSRPDPGPPSLAPGAGRKESGDRRTEADLLARSAGGDTGAYARLVRAHQDAVYGLVCRLVGDPMVAEELTQDTFLKAFRSLSSFRGDARFFTWLYRIAVNVCHDHRASQSARNRVRESSLDAPEIGAFDPVAPFARPDEVVEEEEVAEDFQKALDALEAPYREAFLLRHQEGLSYEELAEVVQISKSNAKVRVHRAREMILEALRALGHEI
jgi:RNA polymerase sigma-70 factor (ECF subfamily)